MWTAGAIGGRLDWPARWGPLLIFLVFAFVKTWGARTFPRMLSAWGWVLFVYLTVGAVWFWPWYVIWLVPVAALVGPGRLFNATQVLCLTSMAMYAAMWRGNQSFLELADYKPLLVMGPPLVYAVVSWLLDARRAATAVGSEPARRNRLGLRQPRGQLVPAQVPADTREQ
jgi:hypothetical protein